MNKEALQAAGEEVQHSIEVNGFRKRGAPIAASRAIKTYLSTVWRQFNPKDKKTWPPSELTPKGEQWLLKTRSSKFCGPYRSAAFVLRSVLWFEEGVAYCDPADLFWGDVDV